MSYPKPIIIINFKTYPSSTGQNAVRLAKICEKVAFETGTDIRIAVCAPDIYHISEIVSIPVYAEHIDEYPPGKYTGSILPETVKTAGATGTLLNHSEHRIPFKKLEDSMKRAKEVSLTTVVCAESTEEAIKIAMLKPDFIAIELPELIGGDVSVSSSRPELIKDGVREIKENLGIRLLVGAGIKTRDDLIKTMELGADGILIASGIDLSTDPEKSLRELLPANE
jgi:triosephosphate isomerase (TIM)